MRSGTLPCLPLFTPKEAVVYTGVAVRADHAPLREHHLRLEPHRPVRAEVRRHDVAERPCLEVQLNITEKEWQAMLADFKKVLDKFKVPAQEQKELFAIVESTKKDIVLVSAKGKK